MCVEFEVECAGAKVSVCIICAVFKRLRWFGPVSKHGTDQALTHPLTVRGTWTWLYPGNENPF